MDNKMLPYEERLMAYLDGELPPAERDRIDRMLAANPAAKQLVDELRVLSSSVQALPKHQLEADFYKKVLRAAEKEVLLGRDRAPMVAGKIAAVTPEPSIDLATLPLSTAPRDGIWGRLSRPTVWASLTAAAALVVMIFSPDLGLDPQSLRNSGVAMAPAKLAKQAAPAVGEPNSAQEGVSADTQVEALELKAADVDGAPAAPTAAAPAAPSAEGQIESLKSGLAGTRKDAGEAEAKEDHSNEDRNAGGGSLQDLERAKQSGAKPQELQQRAVRAATVEDKALQNGIAPRTAPVAAAAPQADRSNNRSEQAERETRDGRDGIPADSRSEVTPPAKPLANQALPPGAPPAPAKLNQNNLRRNAGGPAPGGEEQTLEKATAEKAAADEARADKPGAVEKKRMLLEQDATSGAPANSAPAPGIQQGFGAGGGGQAANAPAETSRARGNNVDAKTKDATDQIERQAKEAEVRKSQPGFAAPAAGKAPTAGPQTYRQTQEAAAFKREKAWATPAASEEVLVLTVRVPRQAWESGAFDEVLVINSVPVNAEAAPPELVLAGAETRRGAAQAEGKGEGKTQGQAQGEKGQPAKAAKPEPKAGAGFAGGAQVRQELAGRALVERKATAKADTKSADTKLDLADAAAAAPQACDAIYVEATSQQLLGILKALENQPESFTAVSAANVADVQFAGSDKRQAAMLAAGDPGRGAARVNDAAKAAPEGAKQANQNQLRAQQFVQCLSNSANARWIRVARDGELVGGDQASERDADRLAKFAEPQGGQAAAAPVAPPQAAVGNSNAAQDEAEGQNLAQKQATQSHSVLYVLREQLESANRKNLKSTADAQQSVTQQSVAQQAEAPAEPQAKQPARPGLQDQAGEPEQAEANGSKKREEQATDARRRVIFVFEVVDPGQP